MLKALSLSFQILKFDFSVLRGRDDLRNKAKYEIDQLKFTTYYAADKNKLRHRSLIGSLTIPLAVK